MKVLVRMILIVICLLAVAILACYLSKRNIEGLSIGECAVQCSGGDVFGCCQCQSSGLTITNTDNYNSRYRKCLCDSGYHDYCYKPVTNFLLSQ